MTCKPRVPVYSTKKKSISSKQIKRKKEPRQLQGGLSMMCFLLPIAATLKYPDLVMIDIEISNSGQACLEMSKSSTAAVAAGGKKPHH